MSELTKIPVGALMRSAALDMFRQLASGAIKDDPTVLFEQLKGMTPPGFAVSGGDAIGGLVITGADKPSRMCTILIASTLGVPLVQDGAPYFDCGTQWAGPDDAIPAADDDKITYGLYAFGDVGGLTFEGTEGAFRFSPQGSVLPFGLTVGWRVSYGAFSDPTFAGAVTLHGVSDLESWCDNNVDDSGSHGGSDTLGVDRVSWSVFTTKSSSGYTFMPVLVESA